MRRETREHASESRERTIRDSYCTEPGCEYEGKPSVQGHCFHKPDDVTDKYISRMVAESNRSIAWMKKQYGDDYDKHLESLYITAMHNWNFTLDEVIKLRCENSALKAAAAIRKAMETP